MSLPLKFDNRALRALPIDTEARNAVRQVANACFTRVQPTPVEAPRLVAWSPDALRLLGVPPTFPREHAAEVAAVMGGCKVPNGADPASHCYCGHQFQSFAGQLGDGAAIYLGEVPGPAGRYELQLKGSGPTPYSRTADGRKVLRSSLREFLCSEAMAGLGIPTTRAATVVTSDSRVDRDPRYDGHVVSERCTVVARVAETFVRFGSFEVVLESGHSSDRKGPSAGNSALAQQLFDFVATTYFPELVGSEVSAPARLSDGARSTALPKVLREVTVRTARLVAEWQCVGFVHGVLNTDNMSVLGLTIDYGPFGFMESFDADFVPNTSDDTGMYRYSRQPEACKWNCLRFAEALAYAEATTAAEREAVTDRLRNVVEGAFDAAFDEAMDEITAVKLGIRPFTTPQQRRDWRGRWFDMLGATGVDMTKAALLLQEAYAAVQGGAEVGTAAQTAIEGLLGLALSREQLSGRLRSKAFASRASMHPSQIKSMMDMCDENPDQIALMFGVDAEAFRGHLNGELRKHEANARYKAAAAEVEAMTDAAFLERNVAAAGAFVTEYLSAVADATDEERTSGYKAMARRNPRFVLRNWIAQRCIEAAEAGDYTLTQRVVERLLHPYDANELDAEFAEAPSGADNICLSCSS